MRCENCPYHIYDVGPEDADEYCEVFGDKWLTDERHTRKDEEGCRYNRRTLDKFKRIADEKEREALEQLGKELGMK